MAVGVKGNYKFLLREMELKTLFLYIEEGFNTLNESSVEVDEMKVSS